jgi:isopentenyl-diphosphate delta-isomerase type 1
VIDVDDVVIDHAAGMPSDLDALILVDSADRDVGRLSKARCHEGNGILHRAFSLLIFDGNGDLLIQQRAPGKRLWPLYWSNSCCSHPRSGETMEEATQRRLHEELGISCPLQFLFKFQYHAQFDATGSEHELVYRRPQAARRQALSARAHAGTAVPVQSRLLRLRQDRLSEGDPAKARERRGRAARGRRMRRPMVSIPGGEPLIHKEMPQIVAGIVARKKFVYLCTNAILLAKHIDEYQPSPYLTFSIHLDGNRERHDESVCQEGVFDKAVAASSWRAAQGLSRHHQLHAVQRRGSGRGGRVLRHRDAARRRGHHGLARLQLPRAAQDVFLGRNASKQLFREHLQRAASALGQVPGRSITPRCSWIFSPATRPISARPGAIRPTTCSAGSALLPAVGRGLCADLSLADRRHRVGKIRRRQESALRQLHGPLRLRRHGGQRRFSHPIKALRCAARTRLTGPMAPELPVKYGACRRCRHGGADPV